MQASLPFRRSHQCSRLLITHRKYHDQSFGFRKPREYIFPDYTDAQLENRYINAPLLRYVDSMRTHGHRAARIDPLDLIQREEVAALDPKRYGLTDESKKYNVNGIIWTKPVGSASGAQEEWWTLDEIARHLRRVYVGQIAHEYMHSPSKTERLWFSHLLESETLPSQGRDDNHGPFSAIDKEMKRRIHGLLARSEVLDNFLQLKFPNLKRYGLEGGESMIPALDALFSAASRGGVQHIILGMPHRGRLNLLTDLLQYPPTNLFHKIKGGYEIPEELGAEGDVLSHLVASPILQYPDTGANRLKVSLLPNPSHLEAVNPVALGKTRAKQYALLKTSPADCKLGDRVMCVQLHGDASFAGQGVVMESLALSEFLCFIGFGLCLSWTGLVLGVAFCVFMAHICGLGNLPHFTSGGTVHLVVDNNIGYTTPASNARSSLYCSDVGKMINTPVLHVNGDHPEDVVRAMAIAFRYREYFRKDIIVDLLVYRRWGHNELDLPGLTNPLMYEKIAARRSVPQRYEDKLISENVLTAPEITSVRNAHKSHLESGLSTIDSYVPKASMLERQWTGMVWPASAEAEFNPETGVERERLVKVGRTSVKVPEDFEIHSKIERHVKNRMKSIEMGQGLDWACAEALAFGSLMLEGYDVRISGQDVGRGTFSHRHAMLVDQKTESVIVPLNDELDAPGKLELANSSLSEMAVLGFEYGVSWETAGLLPVWEAQFGDFFNGAQVIIDTYVTSAETKWLKQSGIVLLLPHGLDGAGPEHSSSRLERMLQLSNDPYEPNANNVPSNVNIHVVFPTTPAQYFHLLRRQMKRNFRKPLVVAAPKGLLRLSAASSTLSELDVGTRFQPVLDDPIADPSKVKRVVLLSGKIFYDLIKERQARGLDDAIALVRIEELSPFPYRELTDVLGRYKGVNLKEVCYLQEEPRNQGAYGHVVSRMGWVFGELGGDGKMLVRYLGRRESAVPAPGVGRLYARQQKEVVESAFVFDG